MNPNCEHEQSLLAGLRAGTMHHELTKHVERCEICQEIVFVAKCLQEEMALDAAKVCLPPTEFIWRRAQERARANAVAKATLPIVCARMAAYAVATLGAVWLCVASPALPVWIPEIGSRLIPDSDRIGALLFSGSLSAAIIASFVCIGVSSWYVLRQD